MATVNLTGFFRDDDGHGWSETHQIDGGSSVVTLTTFADNFETLMERFRVPLLASDGFYIGCRASYRTANGQNASTDRQPLNGLPMSGPQTSQGSPVQMNQASDAVLVSFANASMTQRSEVFLRGVWDVVISAGVLDFSTPQGQQWLKNLNGYTTALITGNYGWTGRNFATTSRGLVTNYVQDAGGTVTFTLAQTNGIALPVTTQPVPFSFSRINRSRSILNRTIICRIINPTTVQSVQLISVSDFETQGHYIQPSTGLIPYASVNTLRVSSRKTGIPFGVGRGRRRAEVLH